MKLRYKVITADHGNVVLEPVPDAIENLAAFQPPAGRLVLNSLKREVGAQFEMNAEILVTFDPAPPAAPGH